MQDAFTFTPRNRRQASESAGSTFTPLISLSPITLTRDYPHRWELRGRRSRSRRSGRLPARRATRRSSPSTGISGAGFVTNRTTGPAMGATTSWSTSEPASGWTERHCARSSKPTQRANRGGGMDHQRHSAARRFGGRETPQLAQCANPENTEPPASLQLVDVEIATEVGASAVGETVERISTLSLPVQKSILVQSYARARDVSAGIPDVLCDITGAQLDRRLFVEIPKYFFLQFQGWFRHLSSYSRYSANHWNHVLVFTAYNGTTDPLIEYSIDRWKTLSTWHVTTRDSNRSPGHLVHAKTIPDRAPTAARRAVTRTMTNEATSLNGCDGSRFDQPTSRGVAA